MVDGQNSVLPFFGHPDNIPDRSNEHNIEIGGGLGELAGKVWRVGLMGFNSRKESVDKLLTALEQVLPFLSAK